MIIPFHECQVGFSVALAYIWHSIEHCLDWSTCGRHVTALGSGSYSYGSGVSLGATTSLPAAPNNDIATHKDEPLYVILRLTLRWIPDGAHWRSQSHQSIIDMF
jgi:hypothetical protein